MRSLLRRGALLLLAAAAAAATSGCDCKAILTPTRTDPADVTFTIAGGGGLCGDTAFIGTIEAYRGPKFEHVWQVEFPGKDPPALKSLTYGRVPQGFVEKTPAAPLAPGDELYVNVYGPGYRGKVRVVVGKLAP